MRHIKYIRKVYLLRKENRSLRCQIRYLNKRASYLLQIVKSINPDFDMDENPTETPIQNESIDSQKVLNPIITDLEQNLYVSKYHRDYSFESKLFSYTIYVSSSSAYRVIRDQIPLPSESLLRKYFSPFVKSIEQKLTDIEKVHEIFLERQNLFDSTEIKCCLSIDAFSINTFSNNNNFSFIFLILPFNRNYRPFPIHLYSTQNGNANETTFLRMKQIVEQSRETKFKIVFYSVDGDRFYEPLFHKSFNLILPFFSDLSSIDFKSIFSLFEDCEFLLIGSCWLHLIKNFRSKLLTDNMIVNPITQDPPINSSQLESILNLGCALLDKSSLAKLHDCHPLNLFTIGNALKLFFTASQEAFFFFLVFGFMNESLLNIKLKLKTRKYFLETI